MSKMTPSEFDQMICVKMKRKAEGAAKRGIGFTLTFTALKNIYKSKKCYYTGVELELPTREDCVLKPNSLTIDRIDSSKPYEKGNVVACSNAFNQMKSQVESAGVDGLRLISKAFGKAVKRMEAQRVN